MPYAKGGEAEIFGRYRRSYTGKANTIERQIARGAYSKEDISTMRKQAENYRELASRLYTTERQGGKRVRKSAQEIRKLMSEAEAFSAPSDLFGMGSNVGRRNYRFQTIEINQAGKKGEEGNPISKYTEEQVSRFYRLTQSIWQGKKGNRNAMIMRYLGVSDLESAFEAVLEAGEDFLINGPIDGSVTTSSEQSPEFQQPQSPTDKKSYDDNFVGFDIGSYVDFIKNRVKKRINEQLEGIEES